MARKAITEREWTSFVRALLKNFALTALSKHGDNAKAAKSLRISRSAVDQMKSTGKGSPKTWFKLFAYHAELSPKEIESFFQNFPSLLKEIKPLSDLDELYEEVKRQYPHQEIAGILRLMLSKRRVEEFADVNIKVTPRKKATTKK